MFLGGLDQAVQTELAVLVAATEVAGADLPDQVTALEVVGRDSSLAGVVQAAGQARAGVERVDGGAAAGRHRRDRQDASAAACVIHVRFCLKPAVGSTRRRFFMGLEATAAIMTAEDNAYPLIPWAGRRHFLNHPFWEQHHEYLSALFLE